MTNIYDSQVMVTRVCDHHVSTSLAAVRTGAGGRAGLGQAGPGQAGRQGADEWEEDVGEGRKAGWQGILGQLRRRNRLPKEASKNLDGQHGSFARIF